LFIFLKAFFKQPTSKLAKAITVAFARISFKVVCAVPFTTRMFVPLQFDSEEAGVLQHCTKH